MAGSIVTTVSSRKGRGLVRVDCALTCVSGNISATTIGSFFGRLVGIGFDPAAGANSDMDTGADVTITDHTTGATILSDGDFGTARIERPTIAIVGNTGTAITPADTASDCNRDIFVAGKVDVTIDGATTTDTGLLSLFIEEAV